MIYYQDLLMGYLKKALFYIAKVYIAPSVWAVRVIEEEQIRLHNAGECDCEHAPGQLW